MLRLYGGGKRHHSTISGGRTKFMRLEVKNLVHYSCIHGDFLLKSVIGLGLSPLHPLKRKVAI